MALFSQGQTEQCGVLKARKIYYDNTFKEWHFIIRGDNGVKYEFTYSTSENLHYASTPSQTEVLPPLRRNKCIHLQEYCIRKW